MISILRKIYRNTMLGKIIINHSLWVRNKVIPQETILKYRFKRMLGYSLDLKDPESFNAKIQWLKIHDRSALHSQCADKYAVRDFIKNTIGEKYLIPLEFSTHSADVIKEEKLPNYPIIIKANHTSGGVRIVRDKSIVDWQGLRHFLKKQLDSDYDNRRGKGEWQYEGIKPRLVVEKLLMDEDGNVPSDFKFFCCNGVVKIIQVDLDRTKEHMRNMYDTAWNLLPVQLVYAKGEDIAPPAALDEMIELAEELAKDFIFVRVDLYFVKEKIYFGEMTFHPESGFGKFIPRNYDYSIGKMLRLPI